MLRTIVILVSYLFLSCAVSSTGDDGGSLDSVGDGVASGDANEAADGSQKTTDQLNADVPVNQGEVSGDDTDGDGLSDAEEASLGTDPAKVDTDGDTYSDYHEILEGTDPLDPESRIYQGYWPYYPNKDELENPGWVAQCPGGVGCTCGDNPDCASQNCLKFPQGKGSFCAPGVGDRVPRFVGVDQFGDMVDLYDFAYQGKYIALELSTGWCKPCKALERWFLGMDEDVKENPWWEDKFEPLKEVVMNHEVIWITLLYESYEKDVPADGMVAKAWADEFPKGAPILADAEKEMHTWVKPTGIPNINILNEDLTLLTFSNRGLTDAFEKLLELTELRTKL